MEICEQSGGKISSALCLETSSSPDATAQALINTAAGPSTCSQKNVRREKGSQEQRTQRTRKGKREGMTKRPQLRVGLEGESTSLYVHRIKRTAWHTDAGDCLMKHLESPEQEEKQNESESDLANLQPITHKSHTLHSKKQGYNRVTCL